MDETISSWPYCRQAPSLRWSITWASASAGSPAPRWLICSMVRTTTIKACRRQGMLAKRILSNPRLMRSRNSKSSRMDTRLSMAARHQA